jgi:hypothetical protein
MKQLIFFLFILAPSIGFSQGMKIKWEDRAGREFSVNTHSGNFQYSMIAGDALIYNRGIYSDTGPAGTIKKVGDSTIEWNRGIYSDSGPEGTIKKVGDNTIEWNTGIYSDTGPEGTIKKIGGLTINYNKGIYSDTGPEGTIKNTSGSVNL